jgi:FkbM family methyltransferase
MKIIQWLSNLVKVNRGKKSPEFFSTSDVANWKPVYRVYKSLFLDFLDQVSRRLRFEHLFKGWNQKVVFKDGTILYHSVLTRYADWVSRQDTKYFSDFKRLFQEEISFRQGDILIDIGAHVGSFSIPLAKKYSLKVLAYEPDAANYSCLLKGGVANGLKDFKAEECAVFSKKGMVEFSTGSTPTTGSLASAHFFLHDKGNRTVKVRSTSLRHIFEDNQIDHCKLLKIDCEGGEYGIFEDIDDDFLKKVDYLFIEVHPVKGFSSEEFIDRLKSVFDVRFHRTSTSRTGAAEHLYEAFCINLRIKRLEHV